MEVDLTLIHVSVWTLWFCLQCLNPPVVLIIHSSDPPFFLKGREVNFDYLPRKGEYERIQKGGGSMGQGQIFLKEGGWHFSYLIFQGLPFLHLEITLPFAKLCYAFEEKLFLPP